MDSWALDPTRLFGKGGILEIRWWDVMRWVWWAWWDGRDSPRKKYHPKAKAWFKFGGGVMILPQHSFAQLAIWFIALACLAFCDGYGNREEGVLCLHFDYVVLVFSWPVYYSGLDTTYFGFYSIVWELMLRQSIKPFRYMHGGPGTRCQIQSFLTLCWCCGTDGTYVGSICDGMDTGDAFIPCTPYGMSTCPLGVAVKNVPKCGGWKWSEQGLQRPLGLFSDIVVCQICSVNPHHHHHQLSPEFP